jgi:predicted transposase YbfD/YdcC
MIRTRSSADLFVRSVLKEFAEVPECRSPAYIEHPLINVLCFALVAVLSGAKGWESMALAARVRARLFEGILDLSAGTPSADTFRRVFEGLPPDLFAAALSKWFQSLPASLRGKHLALDGKSLAGTAQVDSPTVPLHLLHLFFTEERLLLAFRGVPGAPGEVEGAVGLLGTVPIAGATVTGDANFCTQKTSKTVVEAQAHYVWGLKGNRGPLFHAVVAAFREAEQGGWEGVDQDHTRSAKPEHGRLEERQVYAMELKEWPGKSERWPGANTIVKVVRIRIDAKTGERSWEEHYYLSDLPAKAARLGRLIRDHWAVENRLHHVLDVAFEEDAQGIREPWAAQNLAAVARLALALLERDDEKLSRTKKREFASLSEDYLLKLLSHGVD